jgi:tetratricopeptide (TPR) repeat protein
MMSAELIRGWKLHQDGRYADAARLYHALLALEPDDADALHLYGVLHHQNGYFGRAVELIGRAVTLRPGAAAFHANLAEAHRALGQHQQAIDCCEAALRLQPDYPEAANNLGLALHGLGRYGEAVDQFCIALRMRPEFALAQNNLGTSLMELGQTDRALDAYRAAVGLDPSLALARSNLGQVLVDRGQAEEALPHCQEAVRFEPNLAASHNNLGNAYRALERWPEAHAAYAEALRLEPELARVHANRGLALSLEGKRADAIACFRRAVDMAPDDAGMWHDLANAYAADEDHAAALPCCQRVVALRPESAGAHSDLGWALQDVGQLSEAAACYARALELQPGHVPALLNHGALHEELGELAEAEACFRRAQVGHPSGAPPLARLATLLRGKLPETDRAAMDELLGQPGLGGAMRGPLLFGMAQVLDAGGDYAAAAGCLAEANALALAHRRQLGRMYDPTAHASFVDRLIAGFTPELFTRLAGAGDDTRLPVFVFGMPRSGTTLVEQVLASHSQVHGAGELRVARQVFESVPTVLGMEDDMLACLEVLDAADVRDLSHRHREALQALLEASRERERPKGRSEGDQNPRPALERIVDKMPDNYLYVGLLALMYPRATFIHVRRDLRDVAVSCWMTNSRSIRWANDPEHLARRLGEYRRLLAHWQAVLPVRVHEVVYEGLVDNFATEARRLVAACALKWEPACLDFHQTARPVRTASVTQVRQPLYRRSLARWKHYESALADLFARLPS